MFDHAADLQFIHQSDNKRVFLFLQGPSSPFFQMLADALVERGHGVRRINICFGLLNVLCKITEVFGFLVSIPL